MEALVARTRPRLLKVARRIGQAQDAEDSVQAAYHALLRKGDLSDGSDVVAWLITTTVRIAYRRKAVAMRHISAAEQLSRPSRQRAAAAELVAEERDGLVRAAVHRLPDSYRDAVVLHHLEELPVAQVAELLGVPVSTVKTRVQRARRLLAGRLSPVLLHALWLPLWVVADQMHWLSWGGLAVKGKVSIGAVVLAFAVGLGAGTGIGVLGGDVFRGGDAAEITPSDDERETAASAPASSAPTAAVEGSSIEDSGDATPRERVRVTPRAVAELGDDDGRPATKPLAPEHQRRVHDVLRTFRSSILEYGLDGVTGPSGPTRPPDPERPQRFPDERVWKEPAGWVETDATQYREVGEDTSVFNGSVDRAAWLFTMPLDEPIAATTNHTLLLDDGVGPDGKVTLTSYGSVLCMGGMAGDILTESYATLVVKGDMTGKIRTDSYAATLIEGRLSGDYESQSYADVTVLGGFTGTMKLYDGAHIYLGGYVGGADLERITSSGRAYILVERSDLAVGEHKRKGTRVVIEVLAN